MQRIHVFDHVGWCLGGRLSAVVTVTVVAACRVPVRACHGVLQSAGAYTLVARDGARE
jgi:hypothetical protein